MTQSAARTKQAERQKQEAMQDLNDRLHVEAYGSVRQLSRSPSAKETSDAAINALLSLSASNDVYMVSDSDSDNDEKDKKKVIQEQIVSLFTQEALRVEKKEKHQRDMRTDRDTLTAIMKARKKGNTDEDIDGTIVLIKSRIMNHMKKITKYRSEIATIDSALKKEVRNVITAFCNTHDHTEITPGMIKLNIVTNLGHPDIAERYHEYISERVQAEYEKKINRMDAESHKENRKKIKNLMNQHFKTFNANQIDFDACMQQLRNVLPEIPEVAWDEDVYDEFVRELIKENASKFDMKMSKVAQVEADKVMKKKLQKMAVDFGKNSDVHEITVDLFKTYLSNQMEYNFSNIEKFDVLIDELIDAESKKKVKKTVENLNLVTMRNNEKRIRAAIVGRINTFDIFDTNPIDLPDTITSQDHLDYRQYITMTVNKEIKTKGKKLLKACIVDYFKKFPDIDLFKLDAKNFRKHMIDAMKLNEFNMMILQKEHDYINHVVIEENSKKVRKEIAIVLDEYINNTKRDEITETTCQHYLLNHWRGHFDSGRSIVDRQILFIKNTMKKILAGTLDLNAVVLTDEEDESKNNVLEIL